VTSAASVGKARLVTARVLLSSQAYSPRLIGFDAAAGIAGRITGQ
jgi:hypothetical protein